MVGGITGAALGLSMADQNQAMIFSVLILFVAWWIHSDMMKSMNARAAGRPCNCPQAILAGIGSGIITGLLGIGGGMVIVPLLMMLGVKSYQSAIAHSLQLIMSNSLVAAISYGRNVEILWMPILIILSVAAIGSWLGSLIAVKHSSQHLQRIFSLILLIISGWTMYRAFL